MTGSASSLVDEFGISLLIFRHGWSRLSVATQERTIAFDVSGVFSDVVATVVDVCDAIIDNREIEVTFFDEPGGGAWKLSPIDAQRHLMIFQVFAFDEYWPDNPESDEVERLELELVVTRHLMAAMIVAELWKVAMLFREPSFQRDRDAFAFEAYDALLRKWEAWTAAGGEPEPAK